MTRARVVGRAVVVMADLAADAPHGVHQAALPFEFIAAGEPLGAVLKRELNHILGGGKPGWRRGRRHRKADKAVEAPARAAVQRIISPSLSPAEMGG
jgi:hypothetical protein